MGELPAELDAERPAARPPWWARADRPSARWTVVAAILSASLLALFVLPIVALFIYASPSEIAQVAGRSDVRLALEFTFYASGLSVLVALGLGVPLGYLLARRTFPGRSVVSSLVALPVVVPHLIVGLGFLLIALPGTPLHAWTKALGIPLVDSLTGVVVVMVFVSAPYTVLASELSFRAVDSRVIESARSLGADPSTAFASVTFPLAARGIITGLLLTWARAVSEIGGLLVLAYAVYPGAGYNGPVTSPISIYIYNLYSSGDYQGAAAVSSLFLLIAFALFLAVRLAERAGRLPWRRGELLP